MIECSQTDEGLYFNVRVQPNASKTEFCGEYDGALKLRISSPAVENAANKTCVATLAKAFGLSKSKINLVSGEHSKNKRIFVKGLKESEFQLFLEKNI